MLSEVKLNIHSCLGGSLKNTNMLIFQLLNDPGLGHCNRIINLVKKHFYNENSIILIPNSSDLILYLENQKFLQCFEI